MAGISNPFPYWKTQFSHPKNLKLFSPGVDYSGGDGFGGSMYLYGTIGPNRLGAGKYKSHGGPVNIVTGAGGITDQDNSNSYGGEHRVTTGAGGTTAGKNSYSYGGHTIITGGNGGTTSGTYANSYGGYFKFQGGAGGIVGAGTGSKSYGGSFYLICGNSQHPNDYNYGGRVSIQAGVANNGNVKANGGEINIIAGAGHSNAGHAYGGVLTLRGGDAYAPYGKSGDVDIHAGGNHNGATLGNVLLKTIPNADPSVTGALFFDPVTNIVHRSP